MKPFTADETSINCKSENNSFNDNSEIFTADDYVCIRITNHREDEEYVFGNFSKDTSDEEIRNYVEKKVREGYEYIIEHGDAKFAYNDNNGLEAATSSMYDTFLINRYNPLFNNLFTEKETMKQIEVDIDTLEYYYAEDDIFDKFNELSYEKGLKEINKEKPDKIIVCNCSAERIGEIIEDAFIPDEGVNVDEDITKSKAWFAEDRFGTIYFVLSTKIKPVKQEINNDVIKEETVEKTVQLPNEVENKQQEGFDDNIKEEWLRELVSRIKDAYGYSLFNENNPSSTIPKTKEEYRVDNYLSIEEAEQLEMVLNSQGITFQEPFEKAYYLINYIDKYCFDRFSNYFHRQYGRSVFHYDIHLMPKNTYIFFYRKHKDAVQTKEEIINLIDEAFARCVEFKGRKFNYNESSSQAINKIRSKSAINGANYDYEKYLKLYIKNEDIRKQFETIDINYDSSRFYSSKEEYDPHQTLYDYLDLYGTSMCMYINTYIGGRLHKRYYILDEDYGDEFGADYYIGKVDYTENIIKAYLHKKIDYIALGLSTNNMRILYKFSSRDEHKITQYLGTDKIVYIPDSVYEFSNNAFKNSNIEEMYFEEGSKVYERGYLSFNNLSNLKVLSFAKRYGRLSIEDVYGCSRDLVIHNGQKKYVFVPKKEPVSITDDAVGSKIVVVAYGRGSYDYLTNVAVGIGDTVKVTGRFHDKELVVIGIRNRSKNSKEYDPANGYWQYVIEIVEKAENKTHIDQSLKMVEVK